MGLSGLISQPYFTAMFALICQLRLAKMLEHQVMHPINHPFTINSPVICSTPPNFLVKKPFRISGDSLKLHVPVVLFCYKKVQKSGTWQLLGVSVAVTIFLGRPSQQLRMENLLEKASAVSRSIGTSVPRMHLAECIMQNWSRNRERMNETKKHGRPKFQRWRRIAEQVEREPKTKNADATWTSVCLC